MFINCKGGNNNFLVKNAYREHLTQMTKVNSSSNETYQYHIPPHRMEDELRQTQLPCGIFVKDV